MSNWKLIIPEATTNLFDDPSFYLADPDTEWNFTGDGAQDFTRSTAQSFYGPTSALTDFGGGTYATIHQTITTTATSYTVSAMCKRAAGGALTTSHCQAWFDDAAQDWASITSFGNGWYYCVYTGTATAAANQFGVKVLEDGMYLDGLQLENKAYVTTYCDGSIAGCKWNGAANASTSTRSAQARSGGRVRDFADDYSFYVTGWTGYGVPPMTLGIDEYAIAPGGQLNSIKTHDRQIVLLGTFVGSSLSNLHSLRQALAKDLSKARYPRTADGWQPVLIRYMGATVPKEIEVHYAGGLEGGIREGFTEKCAIRFSAPDPYWVQVGWTSAVLDTNDTITARYMAGRLTSTGQWDDLGLAADPEVNGNIYAICVASDGSIYFGGDFEDIEDSGDDADYIVRFDPADQSWNVLVGASDVNGNVYSIIEGPDGTIYLCGAFTAVNGVAANDYIVSYDPSADTWAPLGDPDSGAAAITECWEMAFDSSGNLYVVGDFLNFADVAAADYIAKWNGTAWAAVGAPSVGAGFPYCIAIDSQDNIVIGGTFTNFAGDADADYLARWNGSAWADLGSGTQDGSVLGLAFSEDDTLYLVGGFTDQGGDTDCDVACAWNGRQFIPLTGGVAPTSTVQDVAIAPDGRVYVAGSTVGGSEVATWNGSAWEHVDCDLDASRIAVGPADPVIPTNYDVWIGHGTSASHEIAGSTTVTNDGAGPQYPIFHVIREGGTSATLYTLRNETTGRVLAFSYSLLDGERISVDCRPGKQRFYSWFFGDRPGGILANCDFGDFYLQPGDNQITCFVDVAGAPTVTSWLSWRTPYEGVD